MKVEKSIIEEKLKRLRAKQKVLDSAWQKVGDKDLQRLFVDIIPSLLKAERCSIFVLDPQTEHVWLHCGTGLEERDVKVPKSQSIVGEVISTGKPQIRTNIANRAGTHERVDLQTGFTTFNTLCVPIFNTTRNRVVGALQVLNKRGNMKFNENDTILLERFAFHTQMSIENIFLRQEIIKVSESMQRKIRKLENALTKQRVRSINNKEAQS